MQRRRLVAGNWKMNGTRESVSELVDGLLEGLASVGDTEVIVFPPFPYIPMVQARAADSGMAWGGQNLCDQEGGAFTGEVSAEMLLDFGCSHVIVGHSERRSLFGESDTMVSARVARALEAGLTPVLCVGETLEEREQELTESVVDRQLQAVLDRVGLEGFSRLIVAYEPVWAIGTGRTASPEQAQQVHRFIRTKIASMDATIGDSLRLLYGGSVKGGNAAELFAMDDIDGGLIGGASLESNEFLTICRA